MLIGRTKQGACMDIARKQGDCRECQCDRITVKQQSPTLVDTYKNMDC